MSTGPVYVRDALDADLALFEECIADFYSALTRPHDIANLCAAVDVLASAAGPFRRIRRQLNEAVAKTAVEATMRGRA